MAWHPDIEVRLAKASVFRLLKLKMSGYAVSEIL